MKKKIFAALTALCLMAGTSVFAQTNKMQTTPRERPTVEQMAQRMTERMTKELKLSEAQTKQVYDVNLQQVKEMMAMREKMQAAKKAEAEKMNSILSTEQFMQWSKMQGPKFGDRDHGKREMMRRGDRKDAGCKGSCDKPCPHKDKKGKE